MNYIGIDIHKRYSVCAGQDERGRSLAEAKIQGNSADGFVQYLKSLGGKSKVVIEACWNWARIYELLEAIPQVALIVVADPRKTRLIADAQIKTDQLDARALAMLLRGNLIASIHVPPRAARERKNLLRQRLYWARLRTRLRNRTHALLDRQHELALPQCSDLFGTKGRCALERLALGESGALCETDRLLLEEDLELLEVLGCQIKEQEKAIGAAHAANVLAQRLRTLPGMGPILATVAAAEIDSLARFRDPEHLSAYAGLVPTTYASGGKVSHGRLLPGCNKWLRWAFIEAAWVAIGCSEYFGSFYRQHKARGKGSNQAITIVARRMCRIAFSMLQDGRDYTAEPPVKRATARQKTYRLKKTFPGRSAHRLAARA